MELALPLAGPVLVQNSPANRVPSHGTWLFATAHAIDLTPVDDRGRSAPFRLTSMVRPEPPHRFPGFGRPVLAPCAGTVAAVHDGEPDHAAHRGFPSVGYWLTQPRRLASGGWAGLAGNHLIVGTDDGAFVALCHVKQGSLLVRPGDRVAVGQPVAACGNSGNSTEPHLHLQVMDDADPTRASAVPFTFPGGLPRNGEVIDAG